MLESAGGKGKVFEGGFHKGGTMEPAKAEVSVCPTCHQKIPRRERQDEILRFLKDNPERRHTGYTLANELGQMGESMSSSLSALKRRGLIIWDKGKGVKLR